MILLFFMIFFVFSMIFIIFYIFFYFSCFFVIFYDSSILLVFLFIFNVFYILFVFFYLFSISTPKNYEFNSFRMCGHIFPSAVNAVTVRVEFIIDETIPAPRDSNSRKPDGTVADKLGAVRVPSKSELAPPDSLIWPSDSRDWPLGSRIWPLVSPVPLGTRMHAPSRGEQTPLYTQADVRSYSIIRKSL